MEVQYSCQDDYGRTSPSASQGFLETIGSFRLRPSTFILQTLVVIYLLWIPTQTKAQDIGLSTDQIGSISARLAEAAQTSVFSSSSIPPSSNAVDESSMEPFWDIARSIMGQWNGTSSGSPQPLMPDGSAADPASNGVTILMANWTGLAARDSASNSSLNYDYAAAAKSQLGFLHSNNVPKTSDGAISHRVDQLQLWSDFVYMVPPFFAYYGALTRNRTLLVEAYNQCKLYRSYLQDEKSRLWRHVLLGTSGIDEGFWSTVLSVPVFRGNGWAAAGMLRVHASITNSEYANTLKNQRKDLQKWVEEIHKGMYAVVDDTQLFTNWADQPPTAPRNFYDASGTSLVAATVYRASLQYAGKKYKYIGNAERAWATLFNSTGSGSSNSSAPFVGYTHFTQEGWLTPVVNPHSYGEEGSRSAEGQAFVVMLAAARRDWIGVNGEYSAGTSRYHGALASRWAGGLLAVAVGSMTFSF
ncbi:hypothetical protein EST38_g13610 [Candolleomyces aberdarensis]|uniref:Six-hairpin glycosidase n=1 Tax=Candolleomyces aberdarensis TaxID=2316362 RepID=A0A4Q2D1B5_9AGAR|nr:hypothetical protein EST38_g13610 [Candolleomyces aberdarensis]